MLKHQIGLLCQNAKCLLALNENLRRGREMIQIAVINESGVILDKEIQEVLPAFAEQWNADLKSA